MGGGAGCGTCRCIGGSRDDGMHGITLKFPDSSAEMAYVCRRSDQLVANFRTCCFLFCLTGLLGFAQHAALRGLGSCRPWDCETQLPYPRMGMETTWAPLALCLGSGLLGAAAKAPCLIRRVGLVWREAIVAALAIFAMVGHLASSPGYWGRLRGYGAGVVPGSDLESFTLVLFIDVIVTASHLTLPIRWCMLVPVQVGGVVIFAVASFALCNNDHWALLTITLTVLIILASVGKRTIERQERHEFKLVIAERTLRAETEFQLSQVQSADQGRAQGEDQRSVPGSAPSTTESARAFTRGAGQLPEAGGAGLLSAISRVGLHEQWLIAAGQVQLQPGEVLGEGSFGRVIRGSYCGTPVAVKLPKAAGRRPPDSNLVELCNELRILRRLRHPNVVSLFGALLDSGCGFLALVLEVVNGVSLRDFISPPQGSLPGACGGGAGGGEAAAAALASVAASAPADVGRITVLSDISCALWYLHTRQPLIVHGDLKDTNIFVEPGGLHDRPCCAKLLDFGLSRAITKHARPLGGSLYWMAPEVIRRDGQALNTAADVFSFGRLAFFVVTGISLATLMTRTCIRELAARGQLPQMRWPREENGGLVQGFREVAEGCCAYDPAARPCIAEVHPVFAGWLGSAGLRCFGGAGAGQAQGPRREAVAAAAGAPARGPDGSSEEEGWDGSERPATYLMLPAFRPTPWVSQADMLLAALARSNIEVPQTACCFYHARVANLGPLCERLRRGTCAGDASVGQCGRCGVLVLDEDVLEEGGTVAACFTCGREVALPFEV